MSPLFRQWERTSDSGSVVIHSGAGVLKGVDVTPGTGATLFTVTLLDNDSGGTVIQGPLRSIGSGRTTKQFYLPTDGINFDTSLTMVLTGTGVVNAYWRKGRM